MKATSERVDVIKREKAIQAMRAGKPYAEAAHEAGYKKWRQLEPVGGALQPTRLSNGNTSCRSSGGRSTSWSLMTLWGVLRQYYSTTYNEISEDRRLSTTIALTLEKTS